jgi:hypothetical protein
MRFILTTIILTMLAQPVWAGYQSGVFKNIANEVCKKAMAEGVYLGHAGEYAHQNWTQTSTRFFYKDEIYLVDILDQDTIFSGWKCRVFVPKE